MTPSKYTFSEYSPEWPAAFTREAEQLRALLGEELVIAHHIGSTSSAGARGQAHHRSAAPGAGPPAHRQSHAQAGADRICWPALTRKQNSMPW